MKITVVSDLHLEFGVFDLRNTQQADTLVLSGDIVVAADLNRPEISTKFQHTQQLKNFLHQCKSEFKNVVAVAGNHEFYHSRYDSAFLALVDTYRDLGINFLENTKVKIDDVTFLGGTMWTDMNKNDPLTLHAVGGMMNDFQVIKWVDREGGAYNAMYRKFKPIDALNLHNRTKQFLIRELEILPKDEKVVVVTHHAPTKASVHPRFSEDHLMNGGYSSDLSDFILDNPKIKLWTHGHTHDGFDYMVGSTRVVCNPRGYMHYEENPTFNMNMVVEV